MTQTQAQTPAHNPAPLDARTPAALRAATIFLSLVAVVSALPWVYLSLGAFGGFDWGLFGFELFVALGGVMTILVATGRVRVGGAFPVALLCMMSVLLVSIIFGIYLAARNVVGDNHPTIRPWVMRTFWTQIGVMVGLGVIATLDVYRRDRRSWGLALRSMLFLLPVIAAVIYLAPIGAPKGESTSNELSPVRMIAFTLGGLGLGVLLSVGGHLLIRSFEVALPEKSDAEGV